MTVLDWNENVDRDHTSIRNYEDARRPIQDVNFVPKTNISSKKLSDKVVNDFLKD